MLRAIVIFSIITIASIIIIAIVTRIINSIIIKTLTYSLHLV